MRVILLFMFYTLIYCLFTTEDTVYHREKIPVTLLEVYQNKNRLSKSNVILSVAKNLMRISICS